MPSIGRPISSAHLRSGAVGADHVFGPDAVGLVGHAIAHRRHYSALVLHVADIFRLEAGDGAVGHRFSDDDRFEQGLRNVADTAGRGEVVVGPAVGMVAPGEQPADLLAASDVQNTLLPISSCGTDFSLASSSMPSSRSTSMVRWLVMWARGVLASQAYFSIITCVDAVARQQRRHRSSGRFRSR